MTQSAFLSVSDAAKILQLSPSTLAKMRIRGDGPVYTKSGHRRVLYAESSLYEWLTERIRSSTSDA